MSLGMILEASDSPTDPTAELVELGLLREGESLEDLIEGRMLTRSPKLEQVRNIRRTVEAAGPHEVEDVRNIRNTPELELEDDPLDDDLEDDELEELNPFGSLRELRGASSGLAEWSRALLDRALEVRLRVSLGQLHELEGAVEAVRLHLEDVPKVGR